MKETLFDVDSTSTKNQCLLWKWSYTMWWVTCP